MKIIHMLNIADVALMAAGVAAALLMMLVGVQDDRRTVDEPELPQQPRRNPGRNAARGL